MNLLDFNNLPPAVQMIILLVIVFQLIVVIRYIWIYKRPETDDGSPAPDRWHDNSPLVKYDEATDPFPRSELLNSIEHKHEIQLIRKINNFESAMHRRKQYLFDENLYITNNDTPEID